jgi:hypothetical protein
MSQTNVDLRETLRQIGDLVNRAMDGKSAGAARPFHTAPATKPVLTCTPKSLPRDLWEKAAQRAVEINPSNHPPIERITRAIPGFQLTRDRIAVMTAKYWHTKGVRLSVGFLDNASTALRSKIIEHMNAWSQSANVKFEEAHTDPQVRIAFTPGDGYWSYVGTDILSIPANEPTMNLDSFSLDTPDSEYHRVVRHETGHTLGCPHEHMRQELVARIDRDKAIAFFGQTQGWTPAEVIAQVLTPLDPHALKGTPHADPNSIMCYQIPGTITKDGQPIVGGLDIDSTDFTFMASIYPKATS